MTDDDGGALFAAPAAPEPNGSEAGTASTRRSGSRAVVPTRRELAVPATAVAEVVVDVPLPHLDRPFDYLVPDELPGAAGPEDVAVGTRVKVRFAGRERDGWVVGVRPVTDEDAGRRLAPCGVSSRPWSPSRRRCSASLALSPGGTPAR
ncbi:hypothetical protein [Litorihabitans aurantiacus]|uniref:Primosomal protein N' 3' DNA-binding domain-containing protein n=1 Tax=Litorihabitans aurantiacus TaxID=1930061 RepID=A0AA37UQU5_9MICO|nr:hypothetical protein [Litorihabitans aurantiacus]GMA31301.1 hypothetical protein GCM10025875_12930 [Litorihabitans aurantiacus]